TVPEDTLTNAADPLGQGRGGRGDDAARRRVRERLQGDERTHDELARLLATRCRLDPAVPPADGVVEEADRVTGARRVLVRGVPREHERHLAPGFDDEV